MAGRKIDGRNIEVYFSATNFSAILGTLARSASEGFTCKLLFLASASG
jgi:hypothetical protein